METRVAKCWAELKAALERNGTDTAQVEVMFYSGAYGAVTELARAFDQAPGPEEFGRVLSEMLAEVVAKREELRERQEKAAERPVIVRPRFGGGVEG